MSRKDLGLAVVIGAAVGLLVQPILINTRADVILHNVLPGPAGLVRPLIFLFFLLLAPIALAVAGWLGRKIPIIYQFAKFAAVGTLNSFIDLGVLNLETLFYSTPAGQISNVVFAVFKTISFLVATTNSYFWNKLWTFGDKSRSRSGKVAKFYAITILTWSLNVGVATAVKALGQSVAVDPTIWVNIIAPIAGILSAMMGNFLGYKYLVFKSEPSSAGEGMTQ